jgi:hypothetical protein
MVNRTCCCILSLDWIRNLVSTCGLFLIRRQSRITTETELTFYWFMKKYIILTTTHCQHADERKLVRSLAYSGIRVNLAPVPTALLSVLQQAAYYRVGVLVDLACKNSRDALVKVSCRYTGIWALKTLILFISEGNVRIKFRRKYPDSPVPTASCVSKLVKKWRATGSVSRNLFMRSILQSADCWRKTTLQHIRLMQPWLQFGKCLKTE